MQARPAAKALIKEEKKARNADRPALAAACARVTIRHVRKRQIWGITVSEGLGPRSWWYIPESGIYHHPKLTQPRAAPAWHSRRPGEAAVPPGCASPGA